MGKRGRIDRHFGARHSRVHAGRARDMRYMCSVLDVVLQTHSFSTSSCVRKRGVRFPVTSKNEMRRRALVCQKGGGFGSRRDEAGCHYLMFSFMRCRRKMRGRIIAFCVASSTGRLPMHLSVCLHFNDTGTFLARTGNIHGPRASVVGWCYPRA